MPSHTDEHEERLEVLGLHAPAILTCLRKENARHHWPASPSGYDLTQFRSLVAMLEEIVQLAWTKDTRYWDEFAGDHGWYDFDPRLDYPGRISSERHDFIYITNSTRPPFKEWSTLYWRHQTKLQAECRCVDPEHFRIQKTGIEILMRIFCYIYMKEGGRRHEPSDQKNLF